MRSADKTVGSAPATAGAPNAPANTDETIGSADATLRTGDASGRTLRRFGLWIGGGIALALASWGAVGFATYGLHRLSPPPPPLDVQISNAIHGAAQAGLRVSQSTVADLHGSGEISHVFLFVPINAEVQRLVTPTTPDDLRIYDVSGGRLRDVLDFEPVNSAGYSLALRLVGVQDVDGSGRDELVVSLDALDRPARLTNEKSPLLAEWDPLSNSYEVAPLLTPTKPTYGEATPPAVKYTMHPLGAERYRWKEPRTVHERGTGTMFRTYPTSGFIVSKRPFGSYLAARFRVGQDDKGHYIDDLNVWSISTSGPPPLLYSLLSCTNELGFIRYQEKFGEGADEQEWASARRAFVC